jgi:alpha-L-arabinofuranosidase
MWKILSENATRPIIWKSVLGIWDVNNGNIIQRDDTKRPALIIAKDFHHSSYTLSLKARKINGKEGFIIYFHFQRGNRFIAWNIGGWNNKMSAIEYDSRMRDQYLRDTITNDVINTDQWYNIKLVIDGLNFSGYINDELVIPTMKLRCDCSSSGTFGLSTWNTAVEYRDVKIRP